MMDQQPRITTLNDLLYGLFREENCGRPPIQGQPRLLREDYFRLLFPEELCRQYEGKTKSNLTWFFNNDRKNKAVKRSLIRLLQSGMAMIIGQTQRKCSAVLWPDGQHAAFDAEAMWKILSRVSIPSAINERLAIAEQVGAPKTGGTALHRYFAADPAAAFARILLTLAVIPDAPEELVAGIWSSKTQTAMDQSWKLSLEGHIRHGKLLYLDGSHDQAFAVFERAAQRLGRPAQTQEESELYCRLGVMLATGDGHYRDVSEACRYLKMGCLEQNPESYYLLAKYSKGEASQTAMKTAADLGWGAAIREVGNAFYFGTGRGQDKEQAKAYYQRGLTASGEDGSFCAYMLGRILEEENSLQAAVNAYKIAWEKGSLQAYDRLTSLNFLHQRMQPAQTRRDVTPGYCVVNGSVGTNRIFRESLADCWKTTVCSPDDDIFQILEPLARCLFTPEQKVFPKLAVVLLSDNQQENLYQAVSALRALEAVAEDLPQRKWEMAEAVCLYIGAEHDYASLMLDAACAGLRGIAFPIRICDPDWDGADGLFLYAPLFLPCLNQKETVPIRLVVLGSTNGAMSVVRKAVSLPLPGDIPVSISVVGEDGETMERRFRELCPGIASAPSDVRRNTPEFFSYRLSDGGIPHLLRRLRQTRMAQKEASREEIAERIGRGNYFVVAAGSDQENIALAITLRRELLKLDPTFTNLPFIAVQTRSPIAGWMAETLSSSGESPYNSWYNQYGLFCFGSQSQYTLESLDQDILEKRAQAVHLQYAGNHVPANQALADYYCRQYNRDSSRGVALFAYYQLFSAGCVLSDWRFYALPDKVRQLAQQYRLWLEEEDHWESAAKLEHERWNCQMLCSGWESATIPQVETYVQRGSPSYQLYLCKIHPFLCSWEDLESGERRREVETAICSRFPEQTVHDPIQEDKQTVQIMAKLLEIF